MPRLSFIEGGLRCCFQRSSFVPSPSGPSRWRSKVRGKTPMKALPGAEWSHRFCLELLGSQKTVWYRHFLYIDVWKFEDEKIWMFWTCTRIDFVELKFQPPMFGIYAALPALPGAGSPKKSAAARPRVLRKRSFGVRETQGICEAKVAEAFFGCFFLQTLIYHWFPLRPKMIQPCFWGGYVAFLGGG